MPLTTQLKQQITDYVRRQKLAEVHVLVYNWDKQVWEIWEEKTLWKILQRCRRVDTPWGDIE